MRRLLVLCCLLVVAGFAAADEAAPNRVDVKVVAGSRVAPEYPPSAVGGRFEGTVVLGVVVLDDGTVGKIEVIESTHPRLGFEEAAIEAVRQWRFEPATLDGEPETGVTAYAFSFRVPPRASGATAFVAGLHLASTAVSGPVVELPSRVLAANGFSPNRWIGRSIWAVEIPGCGYEMCIYDRRDFSLTPIYDKVYPKGSKIRRMETGSSGERQR